jgi:mono/diheme cytochrome c family protein
VIVVGIVLVLLPFRPSPTRLVSIALSLALAVVLFTAAGMAVVTPARTDLAEQAVQRNTSLSFDGRPGILLVAPGRAGVNHLRLETPGTYLQTETEVFLELSSPDYPEVGGKTVQMYRVQGNAFEHHGTEFSLIGDWEIAVRIEEPGFPSSTSTITHAFGAENESVDIPAAPWKFDSVAGLAGLGLALAGVTGLATALVVKGGPLRKEAGGLAAIATALAVVVILQGRIDPLLVVESGEGAIDPNDLVMVARGEEVYTTYCLSCHGANLRGDGPLSGSLNPPPTDFNAPHAKVHPNADLTYWIQYGIQGTAMPGFRSQLSDQDIRDVIAYIQNWQQNPEAQANATPALGVCEVTPLTFADIPTIFHHGIHPETRRGTPLVRASDSAVQPEVTNDVMWTLEQMVNCANQDVYMSQLQLFTQPMLQEIYPQGASYEVTSQTTSQPKPVHPANGITIQDVQSMSYLADGRIAVTVIFNDPAGVGVIPGMQPVTQVTLILVNVDGVWLIDEIR